MEEIEKRSRKSSFYGWEIPDMKFKTVGFECTDCPNICEIVEIRKNGDLLARWGSKCCKRDDLSLVHEEKTRPLENFIVGAD